MPTTSQSASSPGQLAAQSKPFRSATAAHKGVQLPMHATTASKQPGYSNLSGEAILSVRPGVHGKLAHVSLASRTWSRPNLSHPSPHPYKESPTPSFVSRPHASHTRTLVCWSSPGWSTGKRIQCSLVITDPGNIEPNFTKSDRLAAITFVSG